MRKFDLIPPVAAMARLNAAMDAANVKMGIEQIDALSAVNRVIAQDVISPIPMPEFLRSTMDGFAVRTADGSTPRRIIGEVRMGAPGEVRLVPGSAARIHTGGKLPDGADAVIPIENINTGTGSLSLGAGEFITLAPNHQPPTPNENTIAIGEDVSAGETAIRAGTRLREVEMGGLAALGVLRVHAYRQPRVGIIATGDEVVPSHETPHEAQVRDVNTHIISALVAQHGGLPIRYGIVKDDPAAFETIARKAMAECDALVFMAGSSVSERDFTPDVIAKLGQPGVLQHGIQFRPGKPALFALCDGRPVFGLPGNPVSAYVTGLLFVAPTLWRLQRTHNPPQPKLTRAKLSSAIYSPKNLEHWWPVALMDGMATPIPSKSNLIFSLVRAQGLICLPIGTDQKNAGDEIEVRLIE